MIRKSLICVVIALNMSGSLHAMFNGTKLSSGKKLRYFSMQKTIKLSSAEELRKRLCKNGFDHLVDSTQIDTELGNKELYPLDIAKAIETYVYEYDKYLYLKTPMKASSARMYQQILIACILQDKQKELDELLKQLSEDGVPKTKE